MHPEEKKHFALRTCYSKRRKRESGREVNASNTPQRINQLLAFLASLMLCSQYGSA